jgi:hypothetical protein
MFPECVQNDKCTNQKKEGKKWRRMLAVGSVLGHVRPGDAVWGSGIHEKSYNILNRRFAAKMFPECSLNLP